MFQSGLTAIERVTELMSEPIEIQDKQQHLTTSLNLSDSASGEIIFDNVSFGYKPGEYVLKNLNFKIKPGEKIALVGPTGPEKARSSVYSVACMIRVKDAFSLMALIFVICPKKICGGTLASSSKKAFFLLEMFNATLPWGRSIPLRQ